MDISGILTSANSSAATTDKSKFGNDYNQFLRLLTTQLKNQDPLSPMDTAQFTNQLVQFSQVEQSIKGNDYLQKLLAVNALGMTGIGLGYVGMEVQMPGNSFSYDGTHTSNLSYSMPANAKSGTVSIVDSTGSVVYTTTADLTEGFHGFAWDGKDAGGQVMAAGTYTLKVGAQDAEGKALNIQPYVNGRVTGVQTGDNGSVDLMIGSQLVPVTDVRQARIPIS